MTWPLVKLRVSALAFAGVRAALREAGPEGLLRIDNPGPGDLNLDGVVLVPLPDNGLWPCCSFPRTGGHNSSCTFYGCDEQCKHERLSENSLGEYVCDDCGYLKRLQMAVDDDTKVVDVNTEEDIIIALEILAGAALLAGNRRLYEHIYSARTQYKQDVDLGWSLTLGKDWK